MSNEAKGLLGKIKDFYNNNQRKANIIIIAVVALGVFSYGALQYTGSPGFCNSCHEMNPAFDSWKTSVHSEVTCYSCHMPPGVINYATHKVAAVKEIYLHFTVFNKPNPPKIHATQKKPVNDACGGCHSFNREMAFGGGLNVPHKLHIEQGLSCTTCHARVVHGTGDKDDKKARKPKMETCMKCHDGKKAPDKCGVCHTKMGTPDSHKQANWFQVHGQMTKTINCNECHNWRPDWCMDCHTKKPGSHAVRWRSNHGAAAKADRASCNACHTLNFCMRCHGVQP
ncbi:MAG: NapC/NirT family cytochrome c [Candidatus Aquicultor sp.]|nr:NapC/NirT family cytochrome c [Candidatus Aquicultor sp.]